MAQKKKRTYETDPVKKIENGKPWKLSVFLDEDNALALVSKVKDANGGYLKKCFYQKAINDVLREGFKNEKIKTNGRKK